ncbi:MAG: hypoxanthine phosphoribosyltransferase [Thermodesulfobacteriota bacterium]
METGVLFTEEAIRKRVGELAERISTDYSHVEELVMVGVLRGCYIFLADLSRRLTVPRSIDFISVAAYGKTKTAGPVRLIMDLRTDVRGKHVLIVEDIVDTGQTLDYLVSLVRAREPASLKTCVLLRNSARMEKKVPIDYLGFDIPDVWVVGYGLDYQDRDRALPYIKAVSG